MLCFDLLCLAWLYRLIIETQCLYFGLWWNFKWIIKLCGQNTAQIDNDWISKLPRNREWIATCLNSSTAMAIAGCTQTHTHTAYESCSFNLQWIGYNAGKALGELWAKLCDVRIVYAFDSTNFQFNGNTFRSLFPLVSSAQLATAWAPLNKVYTEEILIQKK